ncbi:peptidoglycan DD-metalloendopeptidase family protein [Bacteroidetes bacterium endosymbiont of Geopemphigus sp.]|uniref:peptidoglycan DD-metalloendopeptidase family protein n=1 Tax=Bacteroidetes bacterium endosymbiont of Geopemphigus sp. TaxID=2047937 RepID=UPI0011AF5BB7|nr:peptidoglycan DD-metalloendopeptidase family protein [Bacteroidetes bacterium endosymbiont of Geopemphigus sp.]
MIFIFLQNLATGGTLLKEWYDFTMGYISPLLMGQKFSRVEKINFQRVGLGLYISVQHPYGFTMLCGYLKGVNVYKEKKIKQVYILGFVGATGETTGPCFRYNHT